MGAFCPFAAAGLVSACLNVESFGPFFFFFFFLIMFKVISFLFGVFSLFLTVFLLVHMCQWVGVYLIFT